MTEVSDRPIPNGDRLYDEVIAQLGEDLEAARLRVVEAQRECEDLRPTADQLKALRRQIRDQEERLGALRGEAAELRTQNREILAMVQVMYETHRKIYRV